MSTTLPHGIIQINEGNIAWYGDITANWQLIDSKIGIYDAAIATIPAPANTGTLTINYGGTTIAMFGADDAGNVTADIPTPGDGTLTVTVNGTAAGTFSANQAGNNDINVTVPTKTSQLTNDSGYLTSSSNLDASKLTSGTVDIARLPQGALERLVKVANEAARYALTIADVQLGDTVQQLDTGIMYVVTDTDHLDSATGYTEYTAGTAASVPWSGVTGKPTFAAVATSGAYSDLTGKPTFAAVATSGAYSDLTGTPTIPTVNNATLTIQRNGTNVATFSANASTNATANITVPTKTSDLTNDSNFVQSSDLATVATSGNYNDLSNKPTIPTVNNATLTIQKNGTTVKTFTANASSNVTANISVPTKTSDLNNDSGFITGVTWNDVSNKPSFATVATSGSYNDLSNKPTIPTVNNATLTIQKNGTTVKTFTANASSNVTANITVPTKTSDLTNDSGFITSENALPVGSYIQFAGSQAPAGFLVCNGGAISRTTYSKLFAVIGTTYGSGNGSTTFNLPNLINRFLQGSTTSGTVENAGLPNITGTGIWGVNLSSSMFSGALYTGQQGQRGAGYQSIASAGNNLDSTNFNASLSNSIYGSSSTVQPPALTCLICIKY